MWSEKKSLVLSMVCTVAFAVVLAAMLAAGPWLAGWVIKIAPSLSMQQYPLFLATMYVGAVPAAVLLYNLYRLLRNLGAGAVFVWGNVRCLRVISWCCFAGALVCAVSVFYYATWGVVMIAAAFVGLIVRVVKNVFSQAIALKEENDLTI